MLSGCQTWAKEVYREVVERAGDRPGAQIIREAGWIKTVSVKDKTQVDLLSGTLFAL